MRTCLDTNAYVALTRGSVQVRDTLSESSHVYVPTIVIGEILAGFRRGTRRLENQAAFDRFLSHSAVSLVAVDHKVAEVYSEIVDELRSVGKPIPTNDCWIAACARAMGAVLLTDDRHFEAVPDLQIRPIS